MTTIDDILSPLKPKDEPLKGFYQADNTNGGASSVPVNAGEVAGKVGVVPNDIANHDPNKGMEDANDVAKQKPHMSFVEMMEQLMPKPKTKEELAAEQKKRKRDAVFATIGDGLNAFHQAYAYSRGIKPLTENKSMKKELRDRWERLDKEDEAKKLQYLNYYMRAKQMDDEFENKQKDYKIKERQQARLEQDQKIRAAKAEAYSNYQASVIAKNEAQAAYWQEKANALEAGATLDEAVKRAEKARKEAQARASDAAAEKHRADTNYRNKQAELLVQPTTTSVKKETTDRRGRTHTVEETRTTQKGGSDGNKPANNGGNQGGKKPLPMQSKPQTKQKKQLP